MYILSFDMDTTTPEEALKIFKAIKKHNPDIDLIAIPNTVSLIKMDKESLINIKEGLELLIEKAKD